MTTRAKLRCVTFVEKEDVETVLPEQVSKPFSLRRDLALEGLARAVTVSKNYGAVLPILG